jgi:hypothetical protein
LSGGALYLLCLMAASVLTAFMLCWMGGNDNSKGAADNERADQRSWADLKQFFTEIFNR